jgi:3-oxoacyl-[acyl-carrier-protein] synthase III
MNLKAKIIGTGSYLPEKVLTNLDFEKMVDTNDEWIVSRTGIKQRHIARKDEYTSTMGTLAAKRALENANISASEIDFILVATITPDYLFPSTACLIQSDLKATNAAAVDFQATCSGYIYALGFAKALVEQKAFKNVLIVASEKLSSIVNYEDRTTCVLFGDGAAACVVSLKGIGYEIQGVTLGADGDQTHLLLQPAGGCRNPASYETVDKKMHFIQMNGKETFKHAVRRMESASKECLDLLNMKEEEISWLIPHQANDRIIGAMAKRFSHIPNERVARDVIAKCGNTSASSVGIAFDELSRSGKIKDKENILFTVFGGGLTWGAAVITKRESL